MCLPVSDLQSTLFGCELRLLVSGRPSMPLRNGWSLSLINAPVSLKTCLVSILLVFEHLCQCHIAVISDLCAEHQPCLELLSCGSDMLSQRHQNVKVLLLYGMHAQSNAAM